MAAVNATFLGVDCATPFLSLALWNRQRGVLADFRDEVGRDHTSRIVPELERLFARAQLAPGRLAGIGVGVGPGSYTGVRVAIATAKGLARAWGVTVGGGSTLAAIALSALQPGETGVAALDARRGNVYAALYRRREDPSEPRLQVLRFPAKLPRDRLQEHFEGVRVVEGVAPDAAAVAAAALDGAPVEALYL